MIGCHSSTELDREMKSTPLERTGSPLIGCTISKRSVIGNPYKKPVFWDAHMWGYGVIELDIRFDADWKIHDSTAAPSWLDFFSQHDLDDFIWDKKDAHI